MTASTLVDYVKITTATTGTGTLVLGPPAPSFRGAEALTNGAQYSYSIQQLDGTWEVGRSIYTQLTGQLTRSPLYSSSGDNSAIALTGTALVSFTLLAEDLAALDASYMSVQATSTPTMRTLRDRFGVPSGVINVLDFYQGNPTLNDRDALRAALQAMVATRLSGGYVEVRVPGGRFDWLDGNIFVDGSGNPLPLTNTDFAIVGDSRATHVAISALGPNGGGLFNLSAASRAKIAGFTFSYSAQAWTNPVFRINGGGDYYVDDIQLINPPGLIVGGDTVAGSRIGMSNIHGASWRADLAMRWVDLVSIANFDAIDIHMNANVLGTTGFVRIAPQGGGFDDTWCFLNCTNQNTGHSTTAFEIDCTHGNVYNGRVIGGSLDHCTGKGLYIHADAGSTYAMRKCKFNGVRVTMDAGYPAYVDWRSTGAAGDFFGNSLTDCVLTYADASEALYVTDQSNQPNYYGLPIYGGSLQNACAGGVTPPNSSVRAGAKIYLNGVNFDKANANSPNTAFAVETTGDFDYSMQGCDVRTANSGTFAHSSSETYSTNKIITNNLGMSEDTVRAFTLALAAAVSPYDAASVSFFAALPVQPSAARKTLYDNLVVSLKSAGVWPLLKLLYLQAAADEDAARTSLVIPTANKLIKNGGLTFTVDRGYTGDGTTGYCDTGFNPTSAGMSKDNMSAFVFPNTNVQSNSMFDLGGFSGNVSWINPWRSSAGTNFETRANSGTSVESASSADSTGFYGWSRLSSTGYAKYIDGVNIGNNSDPSTTLTNSNMLFSQVAASFSTRRVAAGTIALGLTDAQSLALYNAIKTYMTAIGAPT